MESAVSVSQWSVEGGPGSDKQTGGGHCNIVSSGAVTVTSINVEDLPARLENSSHESSEYQIIVYIYLNLCLCRAQKYHVGVLFMF